MAEDIIYHSVEANDLFLLCSDGLYNMVDEDEVAKIIKQGGSLKENTAKLVAAANAAGGTDNITVILAQFVEA